jgi:hypothetical protein
MLSYEKENSNSKLYLLSDKFLYLLMEECDALGCCARDVIRSCL